MIRGRYNPNGPDAIWRSIVKSRADNSCEICKKRQSPRSLHAHHLQSYSDNPQLRTEKTNGVCLCADCHNAFHDQYGRGGNTKSQFQEFLQTYKPKSKETKFRKPKFKIKAFKSPVLRK